MPWLIWLPDALDDIARLYDFLAPSSPSAAQLDDCTQQNLPRYPVPCFRLGCLAAHSALHGRGLGRLLLGCAVERCLEAKKHVTAYALVVDAKKLKGSDPERNRAQQTER